MKHHPTVSTDLLTQYDSEIKQLGFVADTAQRTVITQLDTLRTRLINTQPSRNFLSRIFSPTHHPTTQGIYLWGGVGRGKTWMMDLFFNSLPFKNKQRSHFYRFMQFIHTELKLQHNNTEPLNHIATQLARKVRVLCLDELHVTDIADAMILANLFNSLFAQGLTLVTTSNLAPDELYQEGLQRARFLPAITLLKAHTAVIHLDIATDYRLRNIEHAHTWFDSHAADTVTTMEHLFTQLSQGGGGPSTTTTLRLNQRKLKTRRHAHTAVWFDFKQLLDGPRGQADYIELARCYHTVFISDVPQLDATLDNQARRFISLVDEFYDRGVKLFIAAAAPITTLYQGTQLSKEFARTCSRLIEMQSRQYLALPHRP